MAHLLIVEARAEQAQCAGGLVVVTGLDRGHPGLRLGDVGAQLGFRGSCLLVLRGRGGVLTVEAAQLGGGVLDLGGGLAHARAGLGRPLALGGAGGTRPGRRRVCIRR